MSDSERNIQVSSFQQEDGILQGKLQDKLQDKGDTLQEKAHR